MAKKEEKRPNERKAAPPVSKPIANRNAEFSQRSPDRLLRGRDEKTGGAKRLTGKDGS